jgi:signal transduction histidine kinase
MTGRDRYLAHYSNAVERVTKALGDLRRLVADNPRQQQACSTLEPLANQRFAVLAESVRIQLEKAADPEAQLKLTERGQEIMEQIRALIAQMEATETGLLRGRQADAEANLRDTKRFALVGSAVSFAALVWVFVLLTRENARRRQAEVALQKINEELELRVKQRTAELTHVLTGYKQAEQEIKKLNEDLELRVVERTAQLETANKELEAFSYSVSHDLRAPLRHIGGFVEMLREEASFAMNDKSRQYLQVIRDSTRQMGRLIDNLLAFSRMARAEMKNLRVNMDELVKEVMVETQSGTEGREIEWQIDALPVVAGDRSMLKQVWINLISNAVKYTRSRERTRIEIRCVKNSGREWQFSVRDNGAGFDMRYVDKLFGVFQRLHRAEEFEGTGIGLANVRRIVHRHGGKAWAEGTVNEGATFYFTIPAGDE